MSSNLAGSSPQYAIDVEGLPDSNDNLEPVEDDDEGRIFEILDGEDLEDFLSANAPLLLPGESHCAFAVCPDNRIIEPGRCYEVPPSTESEYPGIFKIKHIVQTADESIVLKGILMKRNTDTYPGFENLYGIPMYAILPKKMNELCMQLKTAKGKIGSSLSPECLVTFPITEIGLERRVIFTNLTPRDLDYRDCDISLQSQDKRYIEEHGVLFCRWKFVEEVDVARKKVDGYQVAPLREEECDADKRESDIWLRLQYGAPGHRRNDEHKPYSAGDAFVGGGGSLRGAHMAGFTPKWALDCDSDCVSTIRQNFPQILPEYLLHMGAENLPDLDLDLYVDCVHISCPCQGHCWMNRGQNPDRDEKNNELITCVAEILKRSKPRMATLEQTNHIQTKNGGWWFRKMIAELTAMGYAVRWRNRRMIEHDVPSNRIRTIVLASCPGEILPDWPKPTNGTAPGLKAPKTVAEALANIAPDPIYHDIEAAKEKFRLRPRALPIVDMHRPLSKIIKTDGAQFLLRDTDGQLYVPTIRQQMRIMTFPDHHTLAGKTTGALTKQIGNAVPSEFQRQIMCMIKKALRDSDKEIVAWERENNVMTIDD